MTGLTANNSIVVGVDGSEASLAALRWAAEQARVLRAEVVAVHAWEPCGTGLAPYAPVSARPTADEQRDQAAEVLASTVRTAFGARIDRPVRAVLIEGPPARVLLQQARGALLLALGRKAHRQQGLPAIGTVGRECLRNATLPVVAVPVAHRPVTPVRSAWTPVPTRSGVA
ncbi:universal stress protein [Streptomyces sp. NBC_01451]|uniref:universal stress protein n=1 Tax=Streptomyces sp. NBC_01451 TaxID=2903872 RepID=UPI002E326B6F|nr:universal stress protein [Streptomyces sp. NBC_01451]